MSNISCMTPTKSSLWGDLATERNRGLCWTLPQADGSYIHAGMHLDLLNAQSKDPILLILSVLQCRLYYFGHFAGPCTGQA